MKKLQPIIFIFLLGIFISTLSYSQSSSQISASTFTAAPTAHYNNIWLQSIADLSGSCDPGTIFFSSAQNDLVYCQDNGIGTGIGTFIPMGGNIWKKSGNYIFPTATASNPSLKVGIGTSTPAETLFVTGNILMRNNVTVTDSLLGTSGIETTSFTITNSTIIPTVSGNTLTILNALAFGNPATSYNATNIANYVSANISDQRFKTDIKPLTNALAAVLQLNPVRFHWLDIQKDADGKVFTKHKVQPKNNIGLLAQDVYKIVPEAVIKPADESRELWQIVYPKLIPLLIQAVKEHITETDTLETDIHELDAQLKILEAK